MKLRLFNSKKRCLKLMILSIFFYCFMVCFNGVVSCEELNENDLYSKACVLMDGKTNRVLFEKNMDEDLAMASTTKIMTCIIALENAPLDMKIKVSDYAAKMPEVSLGMNEGEEYILEDLLYSLMLESHNDTAVAIAEGVAGSVEAFAKLMNEKAIVLNCEDTYFITPNGLDETDSSGNYHHTTAKDLGRIMSYCINQSEKKEEFINITQKQSYSFSDCTGKRSFTCNNHNAFLSMMEGALSGKTGFTNKAGYCYVGALRKDNKDFVVALLACGWPNNKNYKWSDTKSMMNYGLNNYDLKKIKIPYEEITFLVENGRYDIDKETEKISEAEVVISDEGYLMAEDEDVQIKYEIMENIEAPVDKGESIGNIIYSINDYVVYEGDILACEDVKEKNILWAIEELLLAFFSLSFII